MQFYGLHIYGSTDCKIYVYVPMVYILFILDSSFHSRFYLLLKE